MRWWSVRSRLFSKVPCSMVFPCNSNIVEIEHTCVMEKIAREFASKKETKSTLLRVTTREVLMHGGCRISRVNLARGCVSVVPEY